MIDFTSIEYLKHGNAIQKDAYKVLSNLRLFYILQEYDPILTGTIPIEINIPSSDLDIICHCEKHESFKNQVTKEYSHLDNYSIETKNINKVNTTIARFTKGGFSIEIFGQNIPSKEQAAYIHMIIEYEILNKMGEEFKSQIIELKKSGIKTEPAFAQLLNLNGDPYEALLRYKL